MTLKELIEKCNELEKQGHGGRKVMYDDIIKILDIEYESDGDYVVIR